MLATTFFLSLLVSKFQSVIFLLDFAFIDWTFDIGMAEWDKAFDPREAKLRAVALQLINSNPNLVIFNWTHWSSMSTFCTYSNFCR